MSTLAVNSIIPANAGSEDYFLARAWVNFNGTGTVAIRADGNVSSITDNATGRYTVNMASALTDANYSFVGTCGISAATGASYGMYIVEELDASQAPSKTTTTYRMLSVQYQAVSADSASCMTEVIR